MRSRRVQLLGGMVVAVALRTRSAAFIVRNVTATKR
jgi:hypothetical protein